MPGRVGIGLYVGRRGRGVSGKGIDDANERGGEGSSDALGLAPEMCELKRSHVLIRDYALRR